MIQKQLHQIKSLVRHCLSDPGYAIRQMIGYFKPPLFLYQMGKVGSSTHKNTLAASYYVRHFHDRLEYADVKVNAVSRCGKTFKGPYDVITVTRDPVSRKVSTFFQNILDPSVYDFSFSSKEAVLSAGVGELIRRFDEWNEGVTEATLWYDKHFEESLGLNIYDHLFNAEQGWGIVREGDWRILILRFEDIRINHLEGINSFITSRFGKNARLSRLRSKNVSADKWYGDVMVEFKKALTIPKETLDLAYDSQYTKHFYTEKEITKMRGKWAVREAKILN